MAVALIEALLWVLPTAANGMFAGWYARWSFDRSKHEQLSAVVAEEEHKIIELEAIHHHDEDRIHQLEDEVSQFQCIVARFNSGHSAAV